MDPTYFATMMELADDLGKRRIRKESEQWVRVTLYLFEIEMYLDWLQRKTKENDEESAKNILEEINLRVETYLIHMFPNDKDRLKRFKEESLSCKDKISFFTRWIRTLQAEARYLMQPENLKNMKEIEETGLKAKFPFFDAWKRNRKERG